MRTDARSRSGAARGIDHNFVVPGERPAGRAPCSSRAGTRTRLELYADQPGLQVYTGNFLDGVGSSTEGGATARATASPSSRSCFPDTPNRPEWPSAALAPGETYRAVSSGGSLDRTRDQARRLRRQRRMKRSLGSFIFVANRVSVHISWGSIGAGP